MQCAPFVKGGFVTTGGKGTSWPSREGGQALRGHPLLSDGTNLHEPNPACPPTGSQRQGHKQGNGLMEHNHRGLGGPGESYVAPGVGRQAPGSTGADSPHTLITSLQHHAAPHPSRWIGRPRRSVFPQLDLAKNIILSWHDSEVIILRCCETFVDHHIFRLSNLLRQLVLIKSLD